MVATASSFVPTSYRNLSTVGARTLRSTSRGKIISQDPRLAGVLDTIDRVARSSCTVLVSGESGTGKELVVAALHDASARRDAPLVAVNCGAIPANLVESELFGYAKGAFTGANGTHHGLVAAAEGGTLFLDEIGELPLAMQVKLLRLLQQREYTPLGDTREVKCDVRIVAATNRNLDAEVRAGRFREDLFYRLNVIHVELPPLRERRADLRMLARHFCRSFAVSAGRDDLHGLSEASLTAIEAYPWPGNVRALENALERGVLLAKGPYVEPEDVFGALGRRALPAPTAATFNVAAPTVALMPVETPVSLFPRTLPVKGLSLFDTVESYQDSLVRQALARTNGNRNQAARLLGMNRTTLVEMIRRRGIAP